MEVDHVRAWTALCQGKVLGVELPPDTVVPERAKDVVLLLYWNLLTFVCLSLGLNLSHVLHENDIRWALLEVSDDSLLTFASRPLRIVERHLLVVQDGDACARVSLHSSVTRRRRRGDSSELVDGMPFQPPDLSHPPKMPGLIGSIAHGSNYHFRP